MNSNETLKDCWSWLVAGCCFLALAFIDVSTNYALAQDWRLEPVIKVGGELDDNATLNVRTDEEVELQGYLLDLYADIFYTSPVSTFFLQPKFLLRNYPDEPDFDSDDLFLRSNYRYQGTHHRLGFRLNFDRQSVRTAERTDSDLDVEDPEDIPDNESGRLFRFGTRDSWRIRPYWDYRFSQTSSIGAELRYIDTQYEDVFAGLLSDFTDIRLNVDFRRDFSDRTTGVLALTGRNYESTGSDSDIDGYGALAGFEYELSEKTRFTAMIGLEDTDTAGQDTDPEIVGYATLNRRLQTIRMFVQYRRSVTATGAGRLSTRDSVNLNFRRLLSEKISAGLGVRAYQSRGIGEGAAVDDRNYVQLQSQVTWYLTSYFSIEAEYRYTVLDRSEVLGERSNSNRLNLWFVYQPRSRPDF